MSHTRSKKGQSYRIQKLEDWQCIVVPLLKQAEGCHIWTFEGNLGAGKTTLIQALAMHLGIVGPVTSPTFSLIQAYDTPSQGSLYHGDFYRLKSVAEALAVGFEDYLYSEAYLFIEWPEIILPILPKPYFAIQIQMQDHQTRIVHATLKKGI